VLKGDSLPINQPSQWGNFISAVITILQLDQYGCQITLMSGSSFILSQSGLGENENDYDLYMM